jgi:branched chain amino acid efflux pump
MSAFLAILVVGVGTYLSRAIFILALADREIPPKLIIALDFVAPAVLSALVVALLIDQDGSVELGWPEASAFIVGAGVAYKTRSHIWTLVAGMTVYWVVRALI